MSDAVVITGAARTPIGAFNGALAGTSAVDLGATAIATALERAGVAPDEVDDTIMGQVLAAGAGQNPARQAAMAAGIPAAAPAVTVNQVCGSGVRTVAMGYQSIRSGEANIVVAGGQENMSAALHAAPVRKGQRMGPLELIDTMIVDGLWDAFNGYHMGQTAENVAARWDISREAQDELALASQQKAGAAQAEGRFDAEIVPVVVRSRRSETTVSQDEHLRPQTTADGLAGLRPVFDREGTVTAGNASGINDGGAAVVLMRASEAERRGFAPLARIASWATAGVDPALMGSGPIPASRLALERAGWSVGDLDLIEANEAFAAQACAVNKDMGWEPERVNVNGGAIALGHPIGASGARVLVTLLHELQRRDARRGLATLCIGGGMGIAICIERD
ncbi:MAG: acetyl-CoA C-acetyltransferase [Pseudomonadota bacterium]